MDHATLTEQRGFRPSTKHSSSSLTEIPVGFTGITVEIRKEKKNLNYPFRTSSSTSTPIIGLNTESNKHQNTSAVIKS